MVTNKTRNGIERNGTERDRVIASVIASVILRVLASIQSSSTYDRRTEDVGTRTTGVLNSKAKKSYREQIQQNNKEQIWLVMHSS